MTELWAALSSLAAVGMLFVAAATYFIQRKQVTKANATSVRLVDMGLRTGQDFDSLREEVAELRKQLDQRPDSAEFATRADEMDKRIRASEESLWDSLATVLEASKRPVVGAGMMKRSVPGVVQELVVDGVMLVEALRDGPLTVSEVTAMPGGVYGNLSQAIPDAQRHGVVTVEDSERGQAVRLTAKGRLLLRILEAEGELGSDWTVR